MKWAWVLVLCLTWPMAAEPGEAHLRKDLVSVRKKIKISQKQLTEANRQERELADDLGLTQSLVEEFSERLRQVRTQLAMARDRHEVLRQQVLESRQRLLRKRRALGHRLREMEMEGEASYLQVLLQARSFTQLMTTSEYLQRVVNSQKQLITMVQREKEVYEYRREAAQRTLNEIRSLEVDFREKVTDLNQAQKKQAALLARLRAHRKRLEHYVSGLEHLSADMEARLQKLIQTRSAALGPLLPGSGRFIWPVTGPITSPFGYRTHPVLGTTRFHAGFDIGVDQGTPIRCADNGVVIMADWYGGYGNCVIVQHSNSLVSLYGHQSRILVRVGDNLRQGQILGEVGSTGMSTGPHLHFEVRLNGTPVDPGGYL